MKRICIFIINLFILLMFNNFSIAEQDSKETYQSSYYTYEVVEVTAETFTLQRTKRNKEIVSAVIERSRRPELQVGDKVRYDKSNNRLRKTLTKKNTD